MVNIYGHVGTAVNLPTLFLGRLRPPKRLTSTLCTYFRQKLTTALLESAEGETKVCGRTGYRTRDLWLLKQTRGEGTYTNSPDWWRRVWGWKGGWAEVD